MYPENKIAYIKSRPNAELALFLADAAPIFTIDNPVHYAILEATKRLKQLPDSTAYRLPNDVLDALESASEALENCYSEDAMDAFNKVNTVLAERG